MSEVKRFDFAAELLLVGSESFVRGDGPGGGFDPFVDIGIGIERAFAGHVFAAGEAAEVIDHAMLFEQLEHGRKAAFGGDLRRALQKPSPRWTA